MFRPAAATRSAVDTWQPIAHISEHTTVNADRTYSAADSTPWALWFEVSQ
jgi:hypothetical protein